MTSFGSSLTQLTSRPPTPGWDRSGLGANGAERAYLRWGDTQEWLCQAGPGRAEACEDKGATRRRRGFPQHPDPYRAYSESLGPLCPDPAWVSLEPSGHLAAPVSVTCGRYGVERPRKGPARTPGPVRAPHRALAGCSVPPGPADSR